MNGNLERITSKKRQLDALEPLSQETSRQLEEWLRVELTYASNAIEGNTLNRLETAEILEKGIDATLAAKPLKDQLEAINHAKAVDLVRQLARSHQSHQSISENDILSIHKLILTSINDEWAGKYRQSEVFVRGANVSFPLPQSVPYAMAEFVEWLHRAQSEHPVTVAADAHFKLVTIHPFVDGNGRTARLLMNLILLIHGYPMVVIRNEERTEYLDAVNRGQVKKDLAPLYVLIEHSVEHSLDTYLAAAQGRGAITPFTHKKQLRGEKLLKIGELAELSSETVHTLRFWTKEGLLKVIKHSKGGYQLYSPSAVEQARRIRYLQNTKRLTLKEIREELREAA